MIINFVTVDDFILLRKELIEEFRKALKENNSQSLKKWIRTSEVCKILSISSSSVQNLRVSGILPYSKIKGTIFYKLEDVEKLLEDNLHCDGR